MNFVYMLRCGDGSLYTGWTSDLVARVKKHASGKGAKCTRAHLPISLAYFEIYDTASEAQRREYAIKQLENHGIEYVLKNEQTGHFHCRRKSDDKLFQFYAGTGKIMGYENKRGIHALIALLDDMKGGAE